MVESLSFGVGIASYDAGAGPEVIRETPCSRRKRPTDGAPDRAGRWHGDVLRADISIESEVSALVDAAVATYGRLDAAVNNAGTELPVTVADSTAEQFAGVFGVNLEGVRACIKHEVRVMRQHGGGAIVNMSSVTSDLTAAPMNGLYGATKGGVDALTKVAAVRDQREV